MSTLDTCTAALGNANVRAFLRVIREGESGHGDDAYRIINGGTHFDAPPWKHPFAGQSAPPGKAAGAYQFIPHTWDRYAFALGLGEDFSPVSQDVGAVCLIQGRGALPAVMAGDLTLACSKLAQEWVSLPGLGLERVQRIFHEYGGTFSANAPDAPRPQPQPVATPDRAATPKQPESAMPILAILSSLLPSVLSLFAPRAQQAIEKVTKAPPEIAGQFIADLFAKLGQVTGVGPITNDAEAIQAVAAITKAPPEQIAEVESHALDYLDKIAPLFDKLHRYDMEQRAADVIGRNAASERAQRDRWDMTPWLVWIAGATSTLVTLGLAGVLIYQGVYKDELNIGLVGLAGPIIMGAMGAWRDIFAYRFDGNPTNNAASAVNAQLASIRK
jgi:muramidase (phage lysozyme)